MTAIEGWSSTVTAQPDTTGDAFGCGAVGLDQSHDADATRGPGEQHRRVRAPLQEAEMV